MGLIDMRATGARKPHVIHKDRQGRKVFGALRKLGVGVEHWSCYRTAGRMHEHDFVEMNIIVSGRGRQRIEDNWYDIERGWLSVIHYDQAHAVIGKGDGLEIVNVYLDPGVFPLPLLTPDLSRVLPIVVPLHPEFRNRQNRVVSFMLADVQTPVTLLRCLERELMTQPPGYCQAIQNYMTLFLMECCRQYVLAHPQDADEGLSSPGLASAGMERVRRYLDSKFSEPLTLGGLAAWAGCNPAHLCRSFKAYTGRSVFGYLKQRRVERAMLLLRSTPDKVLSVAMQSGFADLSHFNRTFRDVIGLSPRAYRDKWRISNGNRRRPQTKAPRG